MRLQLCVPSKKVGSYRLRLSSPVKYSQLKSNLQIVFESFLHKIHAMLKLSRLA